jgi:protein-tyrosine phosphatase
MGDPPRTSHADRIRISYLPDEVVNLDGRIGMTIAPGMKGGAAGGTLDRNLDQDLARLRDRYHTHVLVTLLERGQFLNDEFSELGITDLLVRAQRAGIDTEWTALPDGSVPISLEQLHQLVERILTLVRAGRNVVIHCRDGLGRTGLVCACCLTALGASVDEALRIVRKVRPGAMDLTTQVQCLRSFDELWRRRVMQRARPMAISEMFGGGDSSGDNPVRISQTGLVPFSQAGAATISFVGVDADALAAGVPPAAPLREGDLFHVMPGYGIWLGRGAECDVTLASTQLSRLHAMIAFVPVAEMRLVLVDLNSRNGTWIGDEQINVHFLETGDEFTLARAYRFRFESVG